MDGECGVSSWYVVLLRFPCAENSYEAVLKYRFPSHGFRSPSATASIQPRILNPSTGNLFHKPAPVPKTTYIFPPASLPPKFPSNKFKSQKASKEKEQNPFDAIL